MAGLAWLLSFGAVLPFARTGLPHSPSFIPAYQAALAICDLLTSVLLFGQFARLRSASLLVLAAGYLFGAAMSLTHALSFPGAFAPDGLIGDGLQTTAWIYVFWHAAFPLFVILYAVLAARGSVVSRRAGPALAVCLSLLLAAGLTWAAVAGKAALPVLVQGDAYGAGVAKGITPTVWVLCLAALAVMWRRRNVSVLDLWLLVVMEAWLLDVGLSAVFGGSRFDLGWYAGRMYGLIAACFVLAALLLESDQLYGRLARALAETQARNEELHRSREELARAQRMEAVGRLTGGVAHDFNNLLTVVTGNLDLILRRPEDPARVTRQAEMALKATSRGERLTQQLLTFARRQVTRAETVNPNRLISDFLPFLRQAAGEDVEIVTQLSPVLDPARLDPAQFEAAVLNLVANARDAMAAQERKRIVIRTNNLAPDAIKTEATSTGPFVTVSVCDTGTGMPPDVAARAFDPFFTTKEVGKGSGLGLSQVYGFARSAGGDVRIETAPGAGTTVTIYLPRSADRPAQAEPRGGGVAHLRPATGHETILVVEDDREVLAVVVEGLRDLGYRVLTAENAAEALEVLRGEAEIDLLFSDVVMPGGMNGAQLAVEARRLRPNLKVLLTSGYTASALSQEHGIPENLEVLGKPYRRAELANKLRLVIGGR